MKKVLAEMKIGESGVISEINGGERLIKRFSTLRIIVGARIKKLSAQALRGPVVIGIGRSKVALGFGLAKKIMVEVTTHKVEEKPQQ